MTEARFRAVGFALAGGHSLRMGRDKALLPWGRTTLLDHTLTRLRECCGDVRILCGPTPRYLDRAAPVEVDVVAGVGPLAGVLTGLELLEGRSGLFLATDLPRVPAALLKQLLKLAETHDAVVPVSPEGPQPLAAVYRGTCLAAIRRCLDRGEFRVTSFWSRVKLREVTREELQAFGDPATMFQNLNTSEDYAAAHGR
jgi:molybdopterin-guanine dinucleotide biosynthesis protein A